MYTLAESDITQLKDILYSIHKNAPVEKVMELSDNISTKTSLKDFPYIYAGALYASYNQLENAVLFFNKVPDNTFANILREYILKTKAFNPAVTVFKKANPYTAWTKTNFAKTHFEKSLDAIGAFAERNPPTSNIVSILDIGTGNGILITKIINRILEEHSIDKINLIFLDPSENMLAVSEKHCKENINTNVDVFKICCKSQDMAEENIKKINAYAPIWFTNCFFSIHHMQCEMKVEFLKKIRALSEYCIIGEINWNHDLPEKDSPELIYSVYKNYGYCFQDIMDSALTDNEVEGAIDNFLLSEAINIIINERKDRIDYHTTIEEWKRIVQEAGFSNQKITPSILDGGHVYSFVLEAS